MKHVNKLPALVADLEAVVVVAAAADLAVVADAVGTAAALTALGVATEGVVTSRVLIL
jgi:hypothetical protein